MSGQKHKPGEKGPETEASKAPATPPANEPAKTADAPKVEGAPASPADGAPPSTPAAPPQAAANQAPVTPPPASGTNVAPDAPPGVPMPDPVPPLRLPPGHKRPTIDEFVAAGYSAAWYEFRMREWEWKLVADYEAAEKADESERAHSSPPERRKPNRAERGRVRVKTLKNIHIDAMVVRAGEIAFIPRENVARLVRLGAVEVQK